MPKSHNHKQLHRRAPEPIAGVGGTNHVKVLQKKASTVYLTVYTTQPATFTEEIGGYSTVGSGDGDQVATTSKANEVKHTTTTAAAAKTSDAADTTLPASVVVSTSADLSAETTLAVATKQSSSSSDIATTTGNVASTAAAAAASSSSTSSSTSDSSSDNSGAKAGIAIGVLGGLLVFGLLAWFLFNKRRKQMQQQQADNEKVNGSMGGAIGGAAMDRRSSVQTTRTTATAPRLSLRPVTQFMPNFGERRSSKGAAMALAIASTATSNNGNDTSNNPQSRRPAGAGPTERPSTSQSAHQENPFGNHAEKLDPVSEHAMPAPDLQPSNPFNAPEHIVGIAQTTDSPSESSLIASGAAAGAVALGSGAAAGASLTRKQSTRKDGPQKLDLTKANEAVQALGPVPVPASPAGTEFSMTEVEPGQSPGPSSSAAEIAAAGGPAQSTVHRVELDFKPTLDDEIDLKAGQLVRLLHEYDDGWALCIRLDRSKQGVCPRTCLSTRPVKPRPTGPPGARPGPPVNTGGPPRGPNNGPPNGQRGPPRGPPRGPGPNFHPGQQRPMNPQGGPYPRPESPAMRPMHGGGRPQSPAMMRPQGPPGMPRSQSPGPRGPPNGRPQSPGPRGPPNARPQSPGPRAMSPGPRSQSPGPRQRAYSNAQGPRQGPPGPSPMNPAAGTSPPEQRGPMGGPQGPIGRKPVPGQAY